MSAILPKDLRRYFWCCEVCISLIIDVLLSCFRHDKILRLMLHMIAAVSITVSHHIVAVCRMAAHEAATKISKSDILQHADAVDKSIV